MKYITFNVFAKNGADIEKILNIWYDAFEKMWSYFKI